jgi:uncharacterized membrane protein YkvA (DUF1232 family)
MSWPAVLATALAVLLYLRSPVDLLPDRLGPIGLLDDLLVLVLAAWWVWRRPGGGRRAPREAAEAEWDPWAVLGVPRGAGVEEITRAYREQLKRYHPDRVADLGEELQRVAHRRTIDLQRAYAELVRDR